MLTKQYIINNMYPKQIELQDEKLLKLLEKKGEYITEGRKISLRLDEIEAKQIDIDKALVEAEKLIDISDIDADAQLITEEFNALKARMDTVNLAIRKRLSDKVPSNLKDEYDALNKEKIELEEQRNKYAIKAQKHNDKIIPLVRELLKPHLSNEFEDFGSVKIEDGKIKGEIFSHLEEFKTSFKKKNTL